MLHMSFRHIGLALLVERISGQQMPFDKLDIGQEIGVGVGLTFRAAFTRFAAFGTFWVLATLAGFAAFGRLRKFYER